MLVAIKRYLNSTPAAASQSLLALHGVNRTYDDGAIIALKSIDLQIEAGECIAIVGASGSGKSTLVNILCGIDNPTSGSVHWEGRPIRKRKHWSRLRRSHIGIVFQDFNLIPTLTAAENVSIALQGGGLSPVHRLMRAAVVLDRVGLEHRMHNLVTRLSGGERQRVALARAIVNEPQIIIADEPTGSLDSATAASVADLLFNLRKNSNTALILVTHNEQLAARCDRRVRIKDGVIIEDTGRSGSTRPEEVQATS
jgi:predicted ABC-type transport system involved in lysophospholipase L1 biosynthesis ATPase subunit